jgi:phytoene dehydrogenase-like protein
MKKYDDIVVGSGISGMTLALLLGLNGHSVLLLEKSSRIGGSMARFYRERIPFDTGFHFTGAFHEDGLLQEMLTVLGIEDMIRPIYLTNPSDNRFVVEAEGAEFDLPPVYQAAIDSMKEYFPNDAGAVDRYFEMVENVCRRSAGMDLRRVTSSPGFVDEDYVSLGQVLDELTENQLLKGVLSGFSMCYGVKPAEISFANHCRVSYGLYKSVAMVEDGGEAFIRAFLKRAAGLEIEVRPATHIVECVDVRDRTVGRLALNTGEEVSFDRCTFTIHPKEILKTLPRQHLTKAFIERVSDFEPSLGLFCVYGVVETDDSTGAIEAGFRPSIRSLFPTSDIDELIDPRHQGDQALVIIRNVVSLDGRKHAVVNACEVSFVEHLDAWKESRLGDRPAAYLEYKEKRVERIRDRVIGAYPEYRDSYRILEAASPLTFRDYLNSPDGSAYGVKQKLGQFNVFGRLPLRHMYAAGQSALLPGIVGSMVSSFIVGRRIIGAEEYSGFLNQGLGS